MASMRDMIIKALGVLGAGSVGLVLTACASAQTPKPDAADTAPPMAIAEADRVLAEALSLCFDHIGEGLSVRTAFEAAGFSVHEGIEPDWYYFSYAPDPRINGILNPSLETPFCGINAEQLSLGEAMAFTRAHFAADWAAQIREGAIDGGQVSPGDSGADQNMCDGFHFETGAALIAVKFGAAGNDPICVDTGQAHIMLQRHPVDTDR
jgi:hypothetical protein